MLKLSEGDTTCGMSPLVTLSAHWLMGVALDTDDTSACTLHKHHTMIISGRAFLTPILWVLQLSTKACLYCSIQQATK